MLLVTGQCVTPPYLVALTVGLQSKCSCSVLTLSSWPGLFPISPAPLQPAAAPKYMAWKIVNDHIFQPRKNLN